MSKKYSREETIKEIQKALNDDITTLYKANCINWKGTTKGKNAEYYSEIIAKELIRSGIVKKFSNIPPITRKQSYRVGHYGETKNQSNRKEEIFAKELYCKSVKFNKIGRIFDYQVPLKANQEDKAGKIDLVSYDETEKNVYLLEMKYKNNNETLLRGVLEIATYYQLLNKDKFINDYSDYELKNSVVNGIKKGILIFKDTNQYKEINSGLGSNFKELINELNVEIFLIDYTVEPLSL